VKLADESVCIGPRLPARAISTYRHHQRGEVTDAEAIHRLRFLAEKPDFAERVDKSGFFSSPQAETIRYGRQK